MVEGNIWEKAENLKNAQDMLRDYNMRCKEIMRRISVMIHP